MDKLKQILSKLILTKKDRNELYNIINNSSASNTLVLKDIDFNNTAIQIHDENQLKAKLGLTIKDCINIAKGTISNIIEKTTVNEEDLSGIAINTINILPYGEMPPYLEGDTEDGHLQLINIALCKQTFKVEHSSIYKEYITIYIELTNGELDGQILCQYKYKYINLYDAEQ